jgi:AcrR family transcriptional regulator
MNPKVAATAKRQRLAPTERRSQIIEGAVAYFSEVGVSGNTRLLARRLGVTQSLIFNYFGSKTELVEAVYNKVYLDRLSPEWPALITDRTKPLRTRMIVFYREYADAIFTYEWMRIFMYSGLAGNELNRRYLAHLSSLVLVPLLGELQHEVRGSDKPEMEDAWNLHGGIVYIGIRRFVYEVPCPEDPTDAIERAVDRFLASFGLLQKDQGQLREG